VIKLDDGVHGDGDGQKTITSVSNLKKKKEKKNGLKAKVYLIEAFCFATQYTKCV
jgi:hypothetical protein